MRLLIYISTHQLSNRIDKLSDCFCVKQTLQDHQAGLRLQTMIRTMWTWNGSHPRMMEELQSLNTSLRRNPKVETGKRYGSSRWLPDAPINGCTYYTCSYDLLVYLITEIRSWPHVIAVTILIWVGVSGWYCIEQKAKPLGVFSNLIQSIFLGILR